MKNTTYFFASSSRFYFILNGEGRLVLISFFLHIHVLILNVKNTGAIILQK
jgi:hypothetical protein